MNLERKVLYYVLTYNCVHFQLDRTVQIRVFFIITLKTYICIQQMGVGRSSYLRFIAISDMRVERTVMTGLLLISVKHVGAA